MSVLSIKGVPPTGNVCQKTLADLSRFSAPNGDVLRCTFLSCIVGIFPGCFRILGGIQKMNWWPNLRTKPPRGAGVAYGVRSCITTQINRTVKKR